MKISRESCLDIECTEEESLKASKLGVSVHSPTLNQAIQRSWALNTSTALPQSCEPWWRHEPLNVDFPAELTKSTGRTGGIHLEERGFVGGSRGAPEARGDTPKCVKRLATVNTAVWGLFHFLNTRFTSSLLQDCGPWRAKIHSGCFCTLWTFPRSLFVLKD
jgi:hypothetical protein